jgi:hypothetical protein
MLKTNVKKDYEEGIMKMEELLAVVIKRVGTDFFSLYPRQPLIKTSEESKRKLLLMTLVKIMRELKPICY